jgi:hypothetical protein
MWRSTRVVPLTTNEEEVRVTRRSTVSSDPTGVDQDIEEWRNARARGAVVLTEPVRKRFALVKGTARALGLHRMFHEVRTFVNTDSVQLLDILFSQAGPSFQHQAAGSPEEVSAAARVIAGAQARMQVRTQVWHQQPCTPGTTVRRAELLQKYLAPEERVLCLGDDDFVSVGLALSGPNPVTVLEIDPQLTETITALGREHGREIDCRTADLRKPLPADLCGAFEVVFTDPIYAIDPLLVFLTAAEACLGHGPEARLVTCCSQSLIGPDWYRIEEWAAARGLRIEQIRPGFNEYPKSFRMKVFLRLACGLLFRSRTVDKVSRIPFTYSDLVVFRRTDDKTNQEQGCAV